MASYTGNGDFRSNLADRIDNAVDSAVQKAKSKISNKKKIKIQGEVEIDDKELKEVEEKAKKGIEIPVKPKIDKDIEKEINKEITKEKRQKKEDIPVSQEALYGSKAIQDRISRLYNELDKIEKKVNGESYNRLSEGQANNFAKNLMEYKMYADQFGFLVKDSFDDIFRNLEEYLTKEKDWLTDIFDAPHDYHKENHQGKNYRHVKDGSYYEYEDRNGKKQKAQTEVGSAYMMATYDFTKTIEKGKRQVRDDIWETIKFARQQKQQNNSDNTNQQLDETTAKMRTAQQAAEDLGNSLDDAGKSGGKSEVTKKAEEIHNKLEQIKQDAHKMVGEVGELLSDGVYGDATKDYYDEELQKISRIKEEAKKLRDDLKAVGVDENDSVFGERFNQSNNMINTLDGMIEMYTLNVNSAYQEMTEASEKAQREAEQRIKERTDTFIEKISSHPNFKQYGRQSWINEIKEQLKDEATDVDKLYEDYVTQMEQNKQKQDEQLQKVQRRKDLRKFLMDNYTGTGKREDVNKYIDGYQEFFDQASNLDVKMEDIFANIKSQWDEQATSVDKLTEKERQMQEEAQRIAKNMGEDFGLTKETVRDLGEEIVNVMKNITSTGNDNTGSIERILSLDQNLINESSDNKAKNIRDFMKGKKIQNSPEFKQEFGDDWNRVRRSLGFNVIRNSGGQDLIELLSEMNQSIGTTFKLDSSQADALRQLVDALDSAPDDASSLLTHLQEIGELNFSNITNDIVDSLRKIDPDSLGTYNERMAARRYNDRTGDQQKLPKELEDYVYGTLDHDILYSGLSYEEAIERVNNKAKELGLTFNETAKEWQKLSSHDNSFDDNEQNSQEQLQTEIETRKQRIAELQKQLDDYSDAMRDFDRKAKGNGDEYHRLQEEYLTQHGINPTYIQQEVEQLNKEIEEYENRLQNIHKSTNQSPISSGTTRGVRSVNEETPEIDPSGTKAQTEAEKEQADAAREAAEAEKERKKATEDANTPPPSNNPPGGGHGPKTPPPNSGSGNTPPPPNSGSGGSGNNPPPSNGNVPPKKYRKIIGTTYKDDGSWEKRYSDKTGRIFAQGERYNRKTDELEPYTKEVTNFTKLEQEAIQVTNQLTDAEAALAAVQRQGYGNSELETKLKERIKLLKDQKKELEDQADIYDQEPGSSPYSRALFDERVKKETDLHKNQVEVKDARQLIKEEEAKQKAIEKTNTFITEQEGKIGRLQKQYVDNNPTEKNSLKLPKSDIDKLNELRYGVGGDENNVTGGIQGWFNSHRNQETTSTDREVLSQMIKDYEQTAKLAMESQKIATKLQPKTSEEARASLSKDLNSLLRDIQSSKADVESVKQELENIIHDYREEENKYLKGEESKINSKDFLRGIQARTNVAKSNFQDIEDEYKTNQKQLQEYLDTIKEAENAQSKMNRMQADKISGRAIVGEAEALEELKEKAEAAEEAMSKIREMFAGGKINADQLDKAEESFSTSKTGSVQSIEQKIRAQNNADAKATKSLLTDYIKARDEYQQLYSKSLESEINPTTGKALSQSEENQMTAALARMKEIEESWNEAKAYGLKLTQKQEDAVADLAKAQEESNQGNTDYTKNQMEEAVLQQKASDAYEKMAKKISKMREQSEWRSNSTDWLKQVGNLEDDLGKIDINVKNKEQLKEVLDYIEQIGKERQKLVKGANMQPIGADWQNKAYADLKKWMDQNKKAASAYKDELKELEDQIVEVGSKQGAQEWYSELYKIQGDAADKGLLGKSLGDRFRDQFSNTMTSLATYYLSFQDFIRYGREAISMITELDTQLTEMRKVSSESLETLQDYQLETFDIADRVGTTASQIQSSTADWLRLGKSLPEASKMAELSTKLLNVSEFTDIKDATDALVSSTQAYTEVEASDIVDKLNLIGNNYAVSTDELAQGLQNAGAVLKTQGNDIDQTLALLTAGNLIGQDMSKASAGIRTIALRISGKLMPKHIEIYERVIAR